MASAYNLEDAEALVDKFEVLLNEYGLVINPGSALERICLAPAEALQSHGKPGLSAAETASLYRDVVGFSDTIGHLVAVRDHPCFARLVPHLELLNEGEASQLGPAPPTDQASRKLFELYIGAVAMRISSRVELEHPVHGSTGKNPDVLVDFQGARWGIACKVPTSANPESLVHNLKTALGQVAGSEAERGFPIFNFRNLLDHSAFWRSDPKDPSGATFLAFSNGDQVLSALTDSVNDLWESVQQHVGTGSLKTVLHIPPAIPAVMTVAHVLAPVRHAGVLAATSARAPGWHVLGHHSPKEEDLAKELYPILADGPNL